MTIDNTSVYGAGNTPGQCLQGFTIDLHNLPSGQCATCSLLPGDHVLKVTGFTECAPDYFNQTCVQTPFTIVSASGNADPWAFDLQSLSNGMRVTFSPAGVCDIPPCDSILLIQSARIRGVRASDTLNLTYADVKWRPLRERATRDSQLTTVRYRIDVDPAAIVPYNSIAPYTDAHPGSKGVVSQTATFTDRPLLLDRNFPGPDVLRIVVEFEVNAFCAVGEGKGQWLGKTFWIMERDNGGGAIAVRRDPLRPKDRDIATSQFRDALAKWSSTRDFVLPPPLPPPTQEGGTSCN